MNVSHLDFYERLDIWGRALIASGDHDPTYPVIKDIINYYEFEPEWFCFCYVAFYSIETGVKMCKVMPTTEHWDEDLFRELRQSGELKHFNHERRGSMRNIDNQIKMFNDILLFLDNWQGGITNSEFRKKIMEISFLGEWGSFKLAELFEKSVGYEELEILDMGIDTKDFNSNSSPVGGLRWIFDVNRTLENQKTGTIDFGKNKEYWLPIFEKFGRELAKSWGVGIGEVETVCCKIHKQITGKYFIGHDIAELIELREVLGEEIYENIMKKNFDKKLWRTYQKFPKELKTIYRDKNIMINSEYANKYPKVNIKQIILDL